VSSKNYFVGFLGDAEDCELGDEERKAVKKRKKNLFQGYIPFIYWFLW
jgi:hypothetical protein